MQNPFRRLRRETHYKSAYFQVYEDAVVRPSGAEGTFSWIKMKHGACILALTEDHQVHLVREFKYAIDRPSLELVGGGFDPGESALDTAKRELSEELGLTAQRWTPMGIIDPYTTMVDGPVHLFLAEELGPGERNLDDGEVLEPVLMPLAECVDLVMRGEITQGPSCALILKTWHSLSKGKTQP